MIYYHVDVFSEKPLFGNGLTVVLLENEYGDELLLKIAQELKQYETVFVYPKENDCFPIRVFTVQEELPFAGHPIIGTAAVLHKLFYENNTQISLKIGLGQRIIDIQSSKDESAYSVIMNQGKPEFLNSLNENEAIELAAYFNLQKSDINFQYPIQIVSTGLPYILLPLHKNIENAKIVKIGLEKYIEKFLAKFVYLFNTESLQCRCWDNTGLFEDVATGSAAGPLIAYLVKNGFKKNRELIKISQGKYIGRPSTISGWISDSEPYEVFIEGKVAFFGEGEINI